MDFQFIFFGSLLSLVLLLVATYLFAAIVPYVPFLRAGLAQFVLGNDFVSSALARYEVDLHKALAERDEARNNLLPIANGNFSPDYVRELSEKFSSTETAVKKARQRFDRAVGVAFIRGRGQDAMRFLK